jgi:hypothetical protein
MDVMIVPSYVLIKSFSDKEKWIDEQAEKIGLETLFFQEINNETGVHREKVWVGCISDGEGLK